MQEQLCDPQVNEKEFQAARVRRGRHTGCCLGPHSRISGKWHKQWRGSVEEFDSRLSVDFAQSFRRTYCGQEESSEEGSQESRQEGQEEVASADSLRHNE